MEATSGGDADAMLSHVGEGDDDAFAEFCEHFVALVYGLVKRVVGDSATAETVAAEVFVEAWSRSGDFDPRVCSATSWLLDLAHRHAATAARAKTLEIARSNPSRPNIADVPESLSTLSEHDRDPVAFAYYGALTYREIADLSRVSPATVLSRLHNGLAQLRENS